MAKRKVKKRAKKRRSPASQDLHSKLYRAGLRLPHGYKVVKVSRKKTKKRAKKKK